jgi:4-hydroxy-4-methyl-2-oxoglutarate aldolase
MSSSPDGRDDGRDLALVARLEALNVSVVSDCLDRVGLRDNVMAPHIRPLAKGSRTAGFAATVSVVEVDAPPADREQWYAGEIRAVDSQQPGDVMVVSTSRGSYWGELLATASRARGARGIVADAYTRDTEALIEMDYPTFVAGISAQDSLGRIDVDGLGMEIDCGGVRVAHGDLVLADNDGVAVVPATAADEVLTLAEEKLAAEGVVREKLADGLSVREVFAAHGVL